MSKAKYTVEVHIRSIPPYVFAKSFGNRTVADKCYHAMAKVIGPNGLYEVRLWDMDGAAKLLYKQEYGCKPWIHENA